jgi:hypothetical protein
MTIGLCAFLCSKEKGPVFLTQGLVWKLGFRFEVLSRARAHPPFSRRVRPGKPEEMVTV